MLKESVWLISITIRRNYQSEWERSRHSLFSPSLIMQNRNTTSRLSCLHSWRDFTGWINPRCFCNDIYIRGNVLINKPGVFSQFHTIKQRSVQTLHKRRINVHNMFFSYKMKQHRLNNINKRPTELGDGLNINDKKKNNKHPPCDF